MEETLFKGTGMAFRLLRRPRLHRVRLGISKIPVMDINSNSIIRINNIIHIVRTMRTIINTVNNIRIDTIKVNNVLHSVMVNTCRREGME